MSTELFRLAAELCKGVKPDTIIKHEASLAVGEGDFVTDDDSYVDAEMDVDWDEGNADAYLHGIKAVFFDVEFHIPRHVLLELNAAGVRCVEAKQAKREEDKRDDERQDHLLDDGDARYEAWKDKMFDGEA